MKRTKQTKNTKENICKTFPFLKLPIELQLMIASHLTVPTMLSLLRCNKQIHGLLAPELYGFLTQQVTPTHYLQRAAQQGGVPQVQALLQQPTLRNSTNLELELGKILKSMLGSQGSLLSAHTTTTTTTTITRDHLWNIAAQLFSAGANTPVAPVGWELYIFAALGEGRTNSKTMGLVVKVLKDEGYKNPREALKMLVENDVTVTRTFRSWWAKIKSEIRQAV
jgi:hypothetical protein